MIDGEINRAVNLLTHIIMVETGSFQRACRERVKITRTPAIEQSVLQQVQEIPSTITRSLVHAVRISHSSVWRILREHEYIRFTCNVSRRSNQMIMHLVLLLHNGTLESVLQIPFSLLKYCFHLRHPSQGKEFSTHIAPTCGRRTTSMQYAVVQHRLDFRSMFEQVLL